MKVSQLSAAEKTAIILLALGEEVAAEIFRNMEEAEVKRVGAALSRLGRIEQETIDEVMLEFHSLLSNTSGKSLQGGVDFASKLVEKAFGNSEFGTELTEEIASHNVRMSSLDGVDSGTIYRIIANEHPQTIALILAHADPKKAGELVKLLHESIRTEVITRITNLNTVQPEIIMDIDDMIRKEVERMGIARKKIGGADKAAAILNAMNDDRNEILDNLDERDPDLADSIRSHMFTFEDLKKLDGKGIQTLFKALDRSVWELALRGASDAVSSLVYDNMSSRAATNLKEDIQARGAQKKSDVQNAQQEIVQKAMELEESGEIILGQDEQMVV